LQAAAETIDRPSHNDIELPCAGVTAKRVESRPLISALGAKNAVVLVDLHYSPTGVFSYFAQLTLLVGRGLIAGRDPEIPQIQIAMASELWPAPPMSMNALTGNIGSIAICPIRPSEVCIVGHSGKGVWVFLKCSK